MKERFLAMLLAVVMVMSMVPATVFAAEAEMPALPEAIVTETGVNTTVQAMNGIDGPAYETPVTFTMNFTAVEPNEEQKACYDNWYADFELTINKDVRGVDGYLVGQYDLFSETWVKLGDETNEEVLIQANAPLRIMSLMNMKMEYSEIYGFVKNFDCGIYLAPEYLKANPDLKVTLALKMYDPEAEDTNNYVIGDVYTFTAEDAMFKTGDSGYTSIEEAIEDAEDNAVIEVPVVEATQVQVSESVLEAVAQAEVNVSLAIPTEAGTVTLNKEAITTIAGNEGEGAVVLTVEDITAEEETGTTKVYEVTLTKGGEPISQLGGFADVSVAYSGKNPVVYYVDGENKTEMEIVSFANGLVTFRTSHFSIFEVADDVTEDFVPELPEAIATETDRDIVVDAVLFGDREGVNKFEAPVTFTMNFKAVTPTAAQLDYYKKWYVDYELTVNADVRGVDGYLVGQYDEYSPYWVKMGDEDNTNVVIPANQPIRVMKTLFLGTKSEHMSYNDIVTFVKDFDCGIYFTPEYLEAHPELEVTLELKMWNLHDESEIYTIGDTYTFAANPLEIITQPVSIEEELNAGDTVTFNVEATGAVSYQWYYSTKADGGWSVLEGATSETLSLTAAANNKLYYMCKVFGYNGAAEKSVSVTYTAKENFAIISQSPENQQVIAGTRLMLSLTATGDVASYQWYHSTNADSGWSALAGATDRKLVMTALAGNRDYFMCIVKDVNGAELRTVPVTYTTYPGAEIEEQSPATAPVDPGYEVTFFVTSDKDGEEGVTYQWVRSKRSNGGWSIIKDANESTYTVKATPTNDWYFLCLITDQYGNTTKSEPMTYTCESSLRVENQTTEVVHKYEGQEVTFFVEAAGDGDPANLQYRWYRSLRSNGGWSAIANEYTSVLTMDAVADNKYYYMCKVTDEFGVSVKSEAMTYTAEIALKIVSQSDKTQSVTVGEKVSFTVNVEAVGGQECYYRWVRSTRNDGGWSDFIGIVDEKTLTLTAEKLTIPYYYRCIITDEWGNEIRSIIFNYVVD